MTSILKVITEYCAVYVDDIRLSELAELNPPLYARRMWNYFRVAIPLFNLPAEMPEYLCGTKEHPKLSEPTYDSANYTATQNAEDDVIVSLGMDYIDYELFCCRRKIVKTNKEVTYENFPASYDEETGNVTIHATEDLPMTKGDIFCFDFYSDGSFEEDLDTEIMNILGMCFQVVWQDRFNTDWLSNVTKTEDKSFFEQNRANKMRADGERLKELMSKANGHMRRLESNMYYKKYVGKNIDI